MQTLESLKREANLLCMANKAQMDYRKLMWGRVQAMRKDIAKGNEFYPWENEEDYLQSFLYVPWREGKEELDKINYRKLILEAIPTDELSKLIWDKKKHGETCEAFDKEYNYRSRPDDKKYSDDIPALKERVDILDVIQHYAGQIKYSPGSLIKCPLPAHKDGTPSFSMNRKQGVYKCFGCGSKGSQLDFIMAYESCDLKTAIKKLKSF